MGAWCLCKPRGRKTRSDSQYTRGASQRKKEGVGISRPLFEMFGREDWIRTSDSLVPNQVRYQTAPLPVKTNDYI